MQWAEPPCERALVPMLGQKRNVWMDGARERGRETERAERARGVGGERGRMSVILPASRTGRSMSIRVSPSGTFILALALALPPFPFFLHSGTHMQKDWHEATQGQCRRTPCSRQATRGKKGHLLRHSARGQATGCMHGAWMSHDPAALSEKPGSCGGGKSQAPSA
jgi:hypothetical protein